MLQYVNAGLGPSRRSQARSPSAPANCTGDACNVYIEEWGVEWIEFAILNCAGS